MMNQKASKDDVEDMKLNKTNKTDSENQMKAIDILHRHVQHLIVLLIEVAQQLMNDQAESLVEKSNKRSYILD
jgi:hypothetical protein